MITRTIVRIAAALMLLLGGPFLSKAQAMDLNARQQALIPIAAFTANGNLETLKTSLAAGLDAGLTINEIKEVLVQLYAYAGFPRSLNGLAVFSTVLDERKSKGIVDTVGKEASPLPADLDRDDYGAKVRATLSGLTDVPPPAAWQIFAPTADAFLKQHLFADIFARDVLDFQSRELATVAALAAMSGTSGQLRYHLGAAMNTGLSQAQMKDFITVLKTHLSESEAESASKVLDDVLAARGK